MPPALQPGIGFQRLPDAVDALHEAAPRAHADLAREPRHSHLGLGPDPTSQEIPIHALQGSALSIAQAPNALDQETGRTRLFPLVHVRPGPAFGGMRGIQPIG